MSEIKKWIDRASAEKWAIGEFNISSLETAQGIVAAGERAGSPVIIGTSMGTIRHLGFDYVKTLTQEARRQAQVPVFIHLDHGTEEMAHRCIDNGWDSVMIDVSESPHSENKRVTREVVEHAADKDVLVEAQIGQTWDEEGEREVEQIDTDPAEAQEFVEFTGVDLLAVSIGNTPGAVVGGEAQIKVETLEEISRLISVPTVLHGGTSIGDATVRRTIELGVAKVNIDTVIRRSVADTLANVFKNPDYSVDTRPAMAQVREATTAAVVGKIELIGSDGRV